MKKVLVSFLVLVILSLGGFAGYKVISKRDVQTTTEPTNVEQEKEVETIKLKNDIETELNTTTDKVWEFSFYKPLATSTVTSDNVYVLDQDGNKVNAGIQLSGDQKTILVSPPSGGYKGGSYYEIHFKNQIGYTTGEKVEKPHQLNFSTDRQEAEEVKLNPRLKIIDNKNIISASSTRVEISKDINEIVKVGDILVLKTSKNPQGQAVKVTSTDSGVNKYTVAVEAPNFFELFDTLNINKTYSLTESNFKPAPGVKSQAITSLDPKTQISASNSPGEKYEYKSKTFDMDVERNGIEIEVEDLKLGKSKAKLSGDVNLYTPKVDVDIDAKLLGVKKVEFVTTAKTDAHLLVTSSSKGAEKLTTKELVQEIQSSNKGKGSFEKKLGSFSIPLPTPGLFIEGDVVLQGQIDYKGQIKYEVTFKQTTKKGVIYKNKKINKINSNTGKLESEFTGIGTAGFAVGPKMSFSLTAFKIVGAGVDTAVKAKADGKVVSGIMSKNDLKFLCGSAEAKLVGNGNLILGIDGLGKKRKKLVDWKIAEATFLKKSFEFGECEKTISVKANPFKLQMKAGESQSLKIDEEYFDVKNFEIKNRSFNTKGIKLNFNQSGVATANKNKTTLSVSAKEQPKAKSTTMNLTVTRGNLKGDKLSVPILITNYDEIQKRKEKEKKEKEAQETGNKELWGSTWTRDINTDRAGIDITQLEGNTFRFKLNATHVQDAEAARNGIVSAGDVAGTAKVEGNVATQITNDLGSECRIKMTNYNSYIQVEEIADCSLEGGIGVYYEGKYKKGNIPEENWWQEEGQDQATEDSEESATEETPIEGAQSLLTHEEAIQRVKEFVQLPADSDMTYVYDGDTATGKYLIRVFQYQEATADSTEHEAPYGFFTVDPRTGEVMDVNAD
ncbi:hypothetical protein CN435_22155 [Priestia megaterium]|uniref:hypothetical protein n=1 Tax=Priestia megaterium TaxID=1404 RepID=UPI000BF6E3A1|nr:hypothetical protein [Priestia megaterium]PEW14355.1 hypothetical protein CN435_22155 [Priestia megaterium]